MRNLSLRRIYLPLSLLVLQPLSTMAAEVGTTSGAFAVSPSGAATYSIPITVPPGIAGMQPKLSIEYNSQGGNGPLGIGFSLGGLSAITRCPSTLDQDGFIDGVDFDYNDRFCLDGQRLVAVSGGYGEIGAEYRTELESFSKVVSYGGITGDPAYFMAWTKAGLVMEFGVTGDSRIEAQGKPQKIAWALNKITDTAGNIMFVEYLKDGSIGEFYPSVIYYSGYATVSFTYEPRPDTSTGYVGGSKVTQSRRLNRIATFVNGALVREYVLDYVQSGRSGRSQVALIKECAGGICLKPTEFEWLSENTSGNVGTLFSSNVCSNGYPGCNDADNHGSEQYPDVNGDGLADVCYRSDSGIRCFLGTGAAWGQQFQTDICATGSTAYGGCDADDNYHTIQYPDWDGDGKFDLAFRGNQGVQAFRSTGNGFVPLFSTTLCADGQQQYGVCNDADNYDTLQYPDVNGDGKADICYRGDAGINCFLGTGSGLGQQVTSPACANGSLSYGECDDDNNHPTVRFADMNGDGMADLVFRADSGIQVHASIGNGFTPLYSTTICANGSACGYTKPLFHSGRVRGARMFPDVNGDGLQDICYRSSVQGVGCHLSTGGGAVFWAWAPSDLCADDSTAYGSCNDQDNHETIQFVDVNADGMDDLIYRGDTGVQIWRSTGTGFAQLYSTNICANHSAAYGGCNEDGRFISDNYYTLKYQDVTGDGLPEVLFRSDAGLVAIQTSERRWGLVKRVVNAFNAEVQITYKQISDLATHTPSAGAVYPVQDLQAPFYVVSEHRVSNGLGGLNRITYSYTGAKVHLRGRGLLGFARQTVTNEVTGIQEITDYRQDFPFIGMPIKTVVRTASGLTVSDSEEIIYDKLTLGSGSAATQFVFAKKSVNRSWDITSYNRVITSQVTENEYGELPTRESFFGNLTRSVVSTNAGHESGGAVPYTTVIANTYSNNTSLWHLGRLTRSQVTRSAPDAAAATRTSAFEYHPQTGLLSAEIIEPDNPVFRLRTDYVRDGSGNIVETAVSGVDIVSRTTRREFDPTGRYNTRTINALWHAESRTFDSATGNVLSSTGPNGLVTSHQYDAFGRAIGESFNQYGIYTTKSIERNWCAGSGQCQTGEVFYIRSFDNAGSDSYVFFDLLEREVRRMAKSGNGQLVEVLTQYNARGEVIRKSSPRFPGGALYWTTYSYDAIGRVVTESAPAGQGLYRGTTFSYDGLITTQNVAGQITRRQTNPLGKPTVVTDHLGGQILYTYDAFDNLLSTRDPVGSTTVLVYDLRGRKIEMTEPNMGRWKYGHNVLGELVRQEDAKGQIVTMRYDLLGRMVQRSEPEGVTDWVYDTAWKGALTSVSAPDYIRSYAYTAFGAVANETTSITSITPPSAPTPSSTALQNGQPATGKSGSAGTELRFTLTVPAGATGLKIYTYGGTGDADLYVKLGSAPTPTSYACRSIASDNNDTCNLGSSSGTWHVLVRGYSSFAGLSVVGTYAYGGGSTVLQKDTPVNNIAGYAGTEWRYTFDVPNGTTSIRFTTSGGSGNSEMYVRYNAAPTTASYDCRSDQYGNYAVCDSSVAYNGVANLSIVPYMGVPPPGRYHVMVRGVTSFFGVSLTATYSQAQLPPVNPGIEPDVPIPAPTDTIYAPPNDLDGRFTVTWGTKSCPYGSSCENVTNYQLERSSDSSFADALTVYQGLNRSAQLNLPAGTYYFRVKSTRYMCKRGIGFGYGSWYCDEPSNWGYYTETYSLGSNKTTVGISSNSSQASNQQDVLPEWASLSSSDPMLPQSAADPSPTNLLKDLFDPVRELFDGAPTERSTSSSAFSAQSSAMLDRTLSYSYDSRGRPAEITYPSGLKVRYGYNANGAWDTVTNVSTGVVYWRAQNWDEWGSAYQTRLGNGVEPFLSHDPGSGVLIAKMTGPGGSSTVQSLRYTWDALGNLTAREDNRQGLRETFSYDGLNRLTGNNLYGVPGLASGTRTTSLSYSASGNITSKSGVNYSYGAKPQAVTQAGWMSYSYDANGNMQAAGARSYTWTSYNLPSRIAESDSATDFLYGPERQRIRQSSTSSARGGRLTYFFHALYEEQAYSSYTEQKHHISTPQGVVAIETKGPTNKTEYLHRDHLGSVDAITNAAGQVTQRLSFDAFGKRRGESWELKTTQPDFYTNWGYTGHQQQDDFGLIHMNGRVYDPDLGRFISADPIVQAPEDPQSHNRYSYVRNNPLALVDPSGYSWWGKQANRFGGETRRWERKYGHQIAQITATAVATFICGPCAVYVAGYTSYAIAKRQGASDSDAAMAGVISLWTASAFYGVGSAFQGTSGFAAGAGRVIAHGVVGGASSEASGGDFRHGFLSGAAPASVFALGLHSSGLAILDTFAAAVVAGTAAEVGGGKFANGAATVAFAMTLRSLPDIYKDIVGYDLDIRSGGGAVQKTPTGPPVKGANNVGVQGGPISDPCAACEGGSVSLMANLVPGINAVAGLHDTSQIALGTGFWREALNYPTMPLAAAFTYSAFLGAPLSVLTPQQIIFYSTSPAFNYEEAQQ